MTWLIGLLPGSWGKILAGLSGLAAVAGAGLAMRQSGKDSERAKTAEQQVKNDAAASQVRSEVGGLGHSDLDNQLRRFERKP
jgi:hypothetical protein